ncbi:MAG TPA: D-alanyl-D-alanine endopeptidase [Candidatus Paenalcaligenes intestinipullorum]|uniref:D-alanyl-D-alanine endopeptidase n=1 Tax=Candidatus Paenalcaligenes intestinipullorum TaxID=2838718 RepID=A0A9D2RJB9_9BURK|nr:D-alanyl-D-alanine endopeptidase [Candidatus Paenalcaligenes intestinipullorum]
MIATFDSPLRQAIMIKKLKRNLGRSLPLVAFIGVLSLGASLMYSPADATGQRSTAEASSRLPQYQSPYQVFERNLRPVSLTKVESTFTAPEVRAALRSEIAYVQDLQSSHVLYQKNSEQVRPIASITKLMTALVVVEAGQDMSEMLEITTADIDRLKNSTSRLHVGSKLSRADMLHLALMSSENRAANALGRHYPGGLNAFVRAMNDKARAIGMRQSRFVEPTGLSADNVSTPQDLVKLLQATSRHKLIHQYTTSEHYAVAPARGRQLQFNNTNRLVLNDKWNIQISKTGFINEAGECLVMLTEIEGRKVAIVLLNSHGRYSRIGDAVRLRDLVESKQLLTML